MADESQPARRSAAKRKAKARKTPATKRSMADAAATERPAKTVERPRTTKYIVTVDNVTGMMLKVENFDEKPGTARSAKPTEAQSSSMDAPAAAPTADPTAMVQAYYRGIADYFNTLMTIK